MTLQEFGDLLKQRKPMYADLPSVPLAIGYLKRYPQYADMVGSSADKIQALLGKEGFWDAFTIKRRTETWKLKAESAQYIQEIQLQFEAAIAGVDVPTLMQMKLITHTATTDVQKARDLVDIDRDAAEWNEEGELGITGAKAARKQIDALTDEIAHLRREPQTPETRSKIAFRKRALRDAKNNYHVRFGA